MALETITLRKGLSLSGIAVGLAIFAVGAALLSVFALVGIGLAASGAVAYTWVSLGQRPVVLGLGSALVGALLAWVAMRSMMRWVATSSGLTPVLTAEGTSAILGTSLLMSILPAMGYVRFRAKFGPSFGKSLLYGLVLSLVGGVPLVVLLLGEIGSIAREPSIPVSFLLGVPILFALTLEAAHRTLGHFNSPIDAKA